VSLRAAEHDQEQDGSPFPSRGKRSTADGDPARSSRSAKATRSNGSRPTARGYDHDPCVSPDTGVIAEVSELLNGIPWPTILAGLGGDPLVWLGFDFTSANVLVDQPPSWQGPVEMPRRASGAQLKDWRARVERAKGLLADIGVTANA
jgi:hypothetical protein